MQASHGRLAGDDRIQRIMILALAIRHRMERPAISMEGGKSLWSGLPPPSVRPERNERAFKPLYVTQAKMTV